MSAQTVTLLPWRPLFWEPVSGTGERIMVGVIYRHSAGWQTARILRDDVLVALYGKAAAGARTLIDSAMSVYLAAAQASDSLENLGVSMWGLHGGDLRATAAESAAELLRIAAMQYSSLANLDTLDELEESDQPTTEQAVSWFSTDLKEAALRSNPTIADNFGKRAVLVQGGSPVRFGYASHNLLAHFNVISPMRSGASMRDSHGRLFELQQGREFAGLSKAVLISGFTRDDDPMLGNKQRQRNQEMRQELASEAASVDVEFHPVLSASEGATRLLELDRA